jgi:hypothetical protein
MSRSYTSSPPSASMACRGTALLTLLFYSLYLQLTLYLNPSVQYVLEILSALLKRPGREASHIKYGTEVKNAWCCTSTFQYVFMTWCLIKHRMLRSNGFHSCVVLSRSVVKISPRKPAILTEAFRGFSQSYHANTEIVR